MLSPDDHASTAAILLVHHDDHHHQQRDLSLPLHEWIESAQQLHGIPHQDYSQYHAYCTRRLSRLRHAKDVRRDLVHSSVYVGSGGSNKQIRRHVYVPRNIIPSTASPPPIKTTAISSDEDDDDDVNVENPPTSTTSSSSTGPKELHENALWVLLVGAERAWAHAGELRAKYTNGKSHNNDTLLASLNSSSKSKRSPAQLRHHSLRRLKRAQVLATQLEQVAMQFSIDKIAPTSDGSTTTLAATSSSSAAAAPVENQPVVVTVDQRTVHECQAYASWMRGNWAMEMSNWKTACEEYRSAIVTCRQLATAVTTATSTKTTEEGTSQEIEDSEDDLAVAAESLELRDLFTARAGNILPLLKYCLYEWREANGGTLPDSWDDSELGGTNKNKKGVGAVDTSTITFREQEITIENKNLRVLLLKADGLSQQQQQELTSTTRTSSSSTTTEPGPHDNMDHQDNQFATLLTTFDDAASLVTEELKSYDGAKAGPSVNAKRRELQLLLGYLQYEKLSATCRRLEALLPHLTDDGEIVHVYDALLQNARAVLSLPSGNSEIGEQQQPQEDEFWLQANANVLRIRAFRCYYLSKLYYNNQDHHHHGTKKQFGPTKALLKQAQILCARALEEIAACDDDMENRQEYLTSLEQLQQHDLVAMSCRVQAQVYLSSMLTTTTTTEQGTSYNYYYYNSNEKSGGGSGGTHRSLLMRLADFDPGRDDDTDAGGQRLGDVTIPDVLPLPCKPSFYDVAWNHIGQFPNLDAMVADGTNNNKKSSNATKSGSGLFGWLRG